jgi:hypothetical protein
VTSILAAALAWAAALRDWPGAVITAAFVVAGLQDALAGFLVATDWHGSRARLRARHRLARRRHGRLVGLLCRDSRGLWVASGAGVALSGLVLLGLGVLVAAV